MASPFDRHNYWHHSPASLQKPFSADIYQKHLKVEKVPLFFGSPVAVGRGAEAYVNAILVDGHPPESAIRHAMSELDQHKTVPWDAVADEARLELHRGDILQTIATNALEGVREALKGANQITGQEKLEKNYAGIRLKFLGFNDYFGGNRVAELKIKTSNVADTKSGKRVGALPSYPDPKHAAQVSYYADVLECPASLIYANEKGFRVFDENNCVELTPEGIKRNVNDLRAIAWSRENAMRAAPDWRTLMQMLPPDFNDWAWKIEPKLLAEARTIWGLTE
jgi:hypothetical protein